MGKELEKFLGHLNTSDLKGESGTLMW